MRALRKTACPFCLRLSLLFSVHFLSELRGRLPARLPQLRRSAHRTRHGLHRLGGVTLGAGRMHRAQAVADDAIEHHGLRVALGLAFAGAAPMVVAVGIKILGAAVVV